MRIEVQGAIPAGKITDPIVVGDQVELTARARVVGITEEVIDVTSYSSAAPEFTPGQRTLTLLLITGQVDPHAE